MTGLGRPSAGVLLVVALWLVPLLANASPSIDDALAATRTASSQAERTRELATDLSALVGAQVSPLLVLAVTGAWAVYEAERGQSGPAPWYARRSFLVVLLLVMSALFLARRLPFPLDKVAQGLKLFENKASAIMGFAVFAPRLVDALVAPVGTALETASRGFVSVAWASDGAMPLGASTWVRVATWLLVFAVAFVVFLLSHAIHVLVLLSPFAWVDKLLVTFRFVVLGAVTGAAVVHPVLGLLVCGAVVLVAAVLAGWSFRWLVFGAVVAGDLLLARREAGGAGNVRAFASAVPGVPARTYGRVQVEGATVVFTNRRFVVGPARRVVLPSGIVVERGLLAPVLRRDDGTVACRFPPRYAGGEESLAAALGGLPVRSHALVEGFEAAREWLRAQLGSAAG